MDFFSDFGREKIDSEGLGVFNGRQKPRASGVFYRLDVLDEPGNRAVDLLEDLEEEHVEVELVLEIQFQGVAKVAVDLQDGQEPDELLPIFDDADSQQIGLILVHVDALKEIGPQGFGLEVDGEGKVFLHHKKEHNFFLLLIGFEDPAFGFVGLSFIQNHAYLEGLVLELAGLLQVLANSNWSVLADGLRIAFLKTIIAGLFHRLRYKSEAGPIVQDGALVAIFHFYFLVDGEFMGRNILGFPDESWSMAQEMSELKGQFGVGGEGLGR